MPYGAGVTQVVTQSLAPLITEDVNVIDHVWFGAFAAVTSTQGISWTKNGSPTVQAGAAGAPGYFNTLNNLNNFYSTAVAGWSGTNSGQNFTCIVVAKYSGAFHPNIMNPISNWTAGAGWTVQYDNVGGTNFYFVNSTSVVAAGSPPADGATLVIGFGVSGSNKLCVVNTGSIGSAAANAFTNGSTAVYLGRREPGTNNGAFGGNIYEVYLTATPFTSATYTAAYTDIKNNWAGSGLP